MKKHLLVVIALIALVGFSPVNTQAQTGFNSVIEYCTGTWCQWCPCGHDIINQVLNEYPNTMVLGYHGPSNDPWIATGNPFISMFGFNAYPTGIVGRRTGIISRSGWPNPVALQSLNTQPGVSIVVNNRQYNTGTRTLTASVDLTALTNLTGDYYVNFIITEDNLVYFQQGNGSCAGNAAYVHKHVVRGIVNGTAGTLLATTDNWTQGNMVTVPVNYVLPAGLMPENCKLNILVYKNEAPLSSMGHVQQTKKISVMDATGIEPISEIADKYILEQNYPNPFNPSTNIRFAIPKDGNVSLKFYDMMGREVASYIDNGFLKAGVYNAQFEGAELSSGVYFYTLTTSEFNDTKKMMLVK
jgi:hypothetical protein